jgi:hypothetical protein
MAEPYISGNNERLREMGCDRHFFNTKFSDMEGQMEMNSFALVFINSDKRGIEFVFILSFIIALSLKIKWQSPPI